jgi:signal transduction histidine kinase
MAAIVAPAAVLLWLGIQTFERQHQAYVTLAAEKLSAELEARIHTAASAAFADNNQPIAKTFFVIERGRVILPVLHTPPRLPIPENFTEADQQELTQNRPELALASYRKLLATHQRESLALNGIARCLAKLGRDAEARAAWRNLAKSYPNDRDLSHRPYGIVAAIEADDKAGLYEKIESGQWELHADQAEFFLNRLDPNRTSPYLEQFRFARELEENFQPPGALQENQIYPYAFGNHRIFYRSDRPDRISGFAVNSDWIDSKLRPQLERELGITQTARQDQLVYGGAIGLVLIILSSGVVLLLRDISREARTNRLRAELVSSVSHELKTPITLIHLYGETLLRHAGFREEERSDFYRIIVRESARLGRLVDEVLSFARVEQGVQTYKFEDGDMTPVITQVVNDYREFLERTGFSIEQSLPQSTPPVRFDAAAVSQAVINLIDNAAKYSGDAREIAVRLTAQDRAVTLEVEDHGIGIPAADREKIFDRFYRMSNGSGKGGYGIGLFLVRHIMDAHGGQVEVDSEPGRGSRFRLVFPIVDASSQVTIQ